MYRKSFDSLLDNASGHVPISWGYVEHLPPLDGIIRVVYSQKLRGFAWRQRDLELVESAG
jgi:hypothetical protein